MDIMEILITDEIKVSKHSWTVKRNDKTVGVIRNITSFSVYNNESTSKAFEMYRKIKPFCNNEVRINSGSFYEKDGKIYYLYSTKEQEFYNMQIETFGKPLSPDDYDRYIKRENAVDMLGQNDGITVISARVI